MTNYPIVDQDYRVGRTQYKFSDTRTGTNTPWDLLRYGQYRENYFTRSIHSQMTDSVDFSWRYGGSTTTVEAINNFGYDDVPFPLTADLLRSIYTQWKGSSFNAGVTIAEGKDSLPMIYDRLISLYRASKYLRRGDFPSFFRTLFPLSRSQRRNVRERFAEGRFANAWLEALYGWLPMVYDIYEATEQVKFQPLKNTYNTGWSNTGNLHQVSDEANWDEILSWKNESSKYMKVKVWNQPSFKERWGLTNPSMVAWEIIPYSFVVDWFIPVSSYLTSLHALRVMQGEASVTEVRERSYRAFVYPGRPYGIYTVDEHGNHMERYFSMTRDPKTFTDLGFDLVKELPRAIIPKFVPSVAKVITANALLTQSLRRL